MPGPTTTAQSVALGGRLAAAAIMAPHPPVGPATLVHDRLPGCVRYDGVPDAVLAWAPAKTYGPKLEDITAMLREINGGPPAFEIGPEAPHGDFDEDRPRPQARPREREF